MRVTPMLFDDRVHWRTVVWVWFVRQIGEVGAASPGQFDDLNEHVLVKFGMEFL